MIIEEVPIEEEEPYCTTDDDADPSIERCWSDEPDMMAKNETGALPDASAFSLDGLVWGMAGVTLMCALVMAMIFLKDRKAKRSDNSNSSVESVDGSTTRALPGKAQVAEDQAPPADYISESRVKELKLILERETKEKQGLSEQNNFLKSALEERKATVQMFTSELQVREVDVVSTRVSHTAQLIRSIHLSPFAESGRATGQL